MAPHNGPPDRWMDYSPMGEKISGTRFICMKVPLKPHLSRSIMDEDKFSCDTAVEMALSKGYNIGLVIDLSFTKKYYNPEDFESKNIKYKKIFVPGRVIPKKSIMDEFKETVVNFETENTDNDDLIAVHCTHGLNRTGFMICRHLIDEKKFEPQDAIDRFETARGYKIERDIYRDNLLGVKKTESSDISQSEPNAFDSQRSRSPGARDPGKDYRTDFICTQGRVPGPQREFWNDPFHRDSFHPQNSRHCAPPFQDTYGLPANFVPRQQFLPSQYYYGNYCEPYYYNPNIYSPDYHHQQGRGHRANPRYYPYARSTHDRNRWPGPQNSRKW